MRKIFAVSSAGKTLKSYLDLRFGKCEYVVIYDEDAGSSLIVENPYKNENHSGIQLINFLKEKGISVIITGEVGPMVSRLLEKEKMQLVLLPEDKIRVEEIIERLKNKNK